MASEPFKGGTRYSKSALGFSPAVNEGYDVRASRLDDGRREAALKRANIQLHDGTQFVEFFSSGVTLNVELDGKTAQSANVRDFYAHNIKIPSVEVQGSTLDQRDYAEVIEFIHQAQHNSLAPGGLLQILLRGSPNPEGKSFGGTNLVQEEINSSHEGGQAIIRGAHKSFLAKGYIKAIKRQHERFLYQPNFSFEFVISELTHIYREVEFNAPRASSFVEIYEGLVQKKEAPPKPTKSEAERGAREALKDVNEVLKKALTF